MKTRVSAPVQAAAARPQSLQRVADHRPQAIAQRKLQDLAANAPQTQQLKTLQRMLDSSAVAQRAGAEEELPAQGKFAVAQRVEEEEPMQHKSAVTQRAGAEEELPAQG